MKKALIFLFLFLGGCQLIGTLSNGLHRIYSMVADDRVASDDWSDVGINMAVRDALGRKKAALMIDVEVTVFEGSVLLTGTVPRAEVVNEILSATWSVEGVKKVYNYVRVDTTPQMTDTATEAAKATQIKTRLALTAGINSANYKLVLENKTIYLMGICAGEEEYRKVEAVLKDTDGVDKIIYLMRLPIEE
ncbi:MAG: BON domain-containing protein [Pseudomonadota bacterium]|nr:BON domain-containing protein [Pseudomonadota bacterium]